jgi:tetratricopeptide (TPR) repeat protein
MGFAWRSTMTTKPANPTTPAQRTRRLPLRAGWLLGGIAALLCLGTLFLPELMWAYHVERAGRLIDQGMRWPDQPMSDSIPVVRAPEALRRADAQLRDALVWRPDNAYAYRRRGQIAMAEGRWQEAVALLETARQHAPENDLIIWEQALVREQQLGINWDSAVAPELDLIQDQQLQTLWQAAGLDVQQFINRGEEARAQQRFAEALRWCRRGIMLNPQAGVSWYYSGLAYEGLQQNDQALLAYKQATLVQPDFRDPWNALGQLYTARKAWPEALDAYTRAAEAKIGLSSLAAIYYRIGWLRQYFIQPLDAAQIQQAYQSALAADPPIWLQAEIYLQQGGMLMLEKDAAAAIQYFERVLQLDPSHYQGHVSLAIALWYLGKNTEARHEAAIATSLDPNKVPGYRVLALISESEGDFDQARAFFTRILEIEPDNREAQTAIERLKTKLHRLGANAAERLHCRFIQPSSCAYRAGAPSMPRCGRRCREQPLSFASECWEWRSIWFSP